MTKVHKSSGYIGFIYVVFSSIFMAPGKKIQVKHLLGNIRKVDQQFPETMTKSSSAKTVITELGKAHTHVTLLYYYLLSSLIITLYLIIRLYNILHYTTLHYTTLHYTALHYTTVQYSTMLSGCALYVLCVF